MNYIITGRSGRSATVAWGVTFDASELHAFAAEVNAGAGRIGAQVAAALRKGAHTIEADAKRMAPVDTGTLRQSISSTFVGDGRSGTMAVEIGPSVDYGIYQELGTSTQPGSPFLGPAFDRNISAVAEAVAQIDLLR